MMIRGESNKLQGSLILQKDASKEEGITNFGGTRTSNHVVSSFSGINFNQLVEANNEDTPNEKDSEQTPSSSSSSNSSDESKESQDGDDHDG